MSFIRSLKTIIVAANIQGHSKYPEDRAAFAGPEPEAALKYARKLAGARLRACT